MITIRVHPAHVPCPVQKIITIIILQSNLNNLVSPITPSPPHPLTPSPPHPSPPHSLTPSPPHPLTPSPLTPSPPHPLTPSPLPPPLFTYRIRDRYISVYFDHLTGSLQLQVDCHKCSTHEAKCQTNCWVRWRVR